MKAIQEVNKKSTADLKATIEKLIAEKIQLSAALVDRQNELRIITDPRQLKELKLHLVELD